MSTHFVFSNRLLYASVFGVVVIGGALYMSHTDNTAVQVPPTTIAQVNKTVTITTEAIIQEENKEEQESPNSPTEDATGPSTPQQELTETDILTRNLLKPYIDQSNAETYSPRTSELIVTKATEELFTLEYTPFLEKDIIKTQKTDKDTILQYKKDLYSAIKPIFNLTEYELTLYGRAIQNNSKEDFDALLLVAQTYKQAAKQALLVTAPDNTNGIHLAIINSLNKFSLVLTTLAKGYNDPAASLAGTGNFTEAEESIGQAFSRLQTYFILNEVDKISI